MRGGGGEEEGTHSLSGDFRRPGPALGAVCWEPHGGGWVDSSVLDANHPPN